MLLWSSVEFLYDVKTSYAHQIYIRKSQERVHIGRKEGNVLFNVKVHGIVLPILVHSTYSQSSGLSPNVKLIHHTCATHKSRTAGGPGRGRLLLFFIACTGWIDWFPQMSLLRRSASALHVKVYHQNSAHYQCIAESIASEGSVNHEELHFSDEHSGVSGKQLARHY